MTAAVAVGKPSRLAAVTRGTIAAPPRVLVYGQPGVGKSTLACSAPDAIVIQGEEGTRQINTARFPAPESWLDVREQIQSLIDEPHDFRTLVLDTLDGLEAVLWRDICAEAKVDALEKAWGGYGKGHNRAVERWRELLATLERLASRRQMAIVLVAHSMVKTFHAPDSPDYDRYIPMMNEKAWGAIYQWCDAVLFAQFEVCATDPNAKLDDKSKMKASGARVLRTTKSGGWEAKNRYGMPDAMPMPRENGWAVIAEQLDAPARIRSQIEALLATSPAELAGTVRSWLDTVGDNATDLRDGLERLRARVSQ